MEFSQITSAWDLGIQGFEFFGAEKLALKILWLKQIAVGDEMTFFFFFFSGDL